MFEHHDPYTADPSSVDDVAGPAEELEPPLHDDAGADTFAGLELWPHDAAPGAESPAADDGSAPEVTVPGADGTEFTGPATYDSDGDGVADTIVVRNADGSVISATDADGDGVADRLVVARTDGTVTVSELDDHGNWVAVADGDQHPNQPGTDQPATDQPGADQPGADQHDPEESGTVPAGHLAASGEHGDVDAGEPQYDMNGDGRPETAVVERDGVMYQYSDTDGDGRADQLLQITIADRSATIMVDNGDGWTVATTGHIAADGDFVPDQPAGHNEPAGHGEPVGQQEPAGGQEPIAHPAQQSTAGIELTTPDGQRVEIGAPDQDLDGDGVAESVAVRTDDGHLLIVSDTDADGTADQLIDVDPATGAVSWLAVHDDGGWTVTAHGHVTDDGSLAIDGDGAGEPDRTTEPDHATEPDQATEEQVTVSVDGRNFPAGPATIDSDHDGVPDTVAVPGVGGSTQYYQDTDGDGIADRAWTVNADGSRGAEYTIDGGGEWVQAGTEQPAAPAATPSAHGHPPEQEVTPWGRDR
ncbi:DUF6802 family protein [Nakamurella lactea]|uniref:DUF6802 family protein n=1 Tax=Nakamurella lactea TaxID=459515 RepID=UPI000416499A|nr:DUF6802 family protein [Nakamurella lactea]